MRQFSAIPHNHARSVLFLSRLILAMLAMAMAVIGGARAIGGALYMSAGEAREAIARGKENGQSLPAAVRRLSASTHWWLYDARSWDAYGALYIEAAYERSGVIEAHEATVAADALRQAVAQAPGQPLFWMRRAAAERIADETDMAVRSLRTSIEISPRHPQALRFRFQLGAALWADLPASMHAMIADQGAAAFRQGSAEEKFITRVLRDAPPALRQETLRRLTPQERVTLISALTDL